MQKDMMRLEGKIFNTNNKISSGIAFTRPSEDPENFLSTLRFRDSLDSVKKYMNNAQNAKEHLDYIDSSLNHMTQIFQRLRELVIQGANGTLDINDRENIKKEVLQLTAEIANTANEKYNGKYLFSGFEILRPPFILTSIDGELNLFFMWETQEK